MSSITGKSPKRTAYASELIQADPKDQPALGPTSQNDSISERRKWHWTASPRRTGDLPMSSSSFLTKFWKTAPIWLSQLARPGFWGSLRQKTLSGQIYFDSQMDFGFGLWSILKIFNWLPISKIQEDTMHSNSGYPTSLEKSENLAMLGLHSQSARAKKQVSTCNGVWELSAPLWPPPSFSSPARSEGIWLSPALWEGIWPETVLPLLF